MQTINDIQFNSNLYSQVDHGLVILYQTEGLSLAVPLPNADLLTFLEPFDDIQRCQNHITTNNGKTFTLFTYSDNIETWLWNNNIIPDHLIDIIIFCPFPEDKNYFRAWTRRYTSKVKNIITYDALDRETLIYGMKYIDDLILYFKDNQYILASLEEIYTQICLALSNSFGRAANRQ